jgi:hypothetical protein
MKIAVVFVPRASEVTMFVNNTHKAPRSLTIGRALETGVLTLLLVCALSLVGWKYAPAIRFEPAAAFTSADRPTSYVCAVPARPIAHPIDDSRSLKTGDLVIVKGTTPMLRQVAARPHETLALWSGPKLKEFYAVGGNVFLVTAQDQYTIVRANEIRAALPSSFASVESGSLAKN